MSWRPAVPSVALSPGLFEGGRWVARGPRMPAGAERSPLRILTWNVWFGELEQRARARALLAEALSQDADILCFQEVTALFLETVLEDPEVQARYAVSDPSGETVEPYGVLMLSRLPLLDLHLHTLPSSMGRRLLRATVQHAGRRLSVATIHLESLRWNGEARAEQLELILPILEERGLDAVLCGDMNFAPTDLLEQSRLRPGWVDVWPAVNGLAPGYTSDTTLNRMAASHKGREKHARIDRIFCWAPAGAWRPRAMSLLGTQALDYFHPGIFPSDHQGLVAELGLPETDGG